jgi:hypothetical protein
MILEGPLCVSLMGQYMAPRFQPGSCGYEKKLLSCYALNTQTEHISRRENGAKREGYIDLFPQGLEDGQWVGEDYAFCRLWERMGGEIWVVPDMTLSHHGRGVEYSGNYHEYLMRQPTGSNAKPFDLSNCEVTQGWLTMFEAEFLAEQASTRKVVVEMGCQLTGNQQGQWQTTWPLMRCFMPLIIGMGL